MAAGLISIPNRYMHSPVEMISLDDIDRAADLLARFVEGFAPDADLTPVSRAKTRATTWVTGANMRTVC